MSTRHKELERIIKIIKNLKEEVKKEYKSEVVGIFGSYVRGGQKQVSDIDVLVKFHQGATLLDFGGLAVFLEETVGRKVDVVPIDVIRKEIKKEILREAIYL